MVIGGGAAGMTAAIFAARGGAQVTVLEQLPKVGRKILATGNGRCNFTNMNMDIGKYHGSNVKFAYGVLGRYGYMDTIRFFEDLGLHWIEEDGRVYPASLQASSVLDVLRYEMDYLGIDEVCGVSVEEIIFQSNGFTIKLKDGNKVFGDKVILATGGKANPGLGSIGKGYGLVKSLGHKITDTFPSLVQIKLDSPYLKGIAGIRHTGRAYIEMAGKTLREDFGEVQFTDYGVSGIPALQLSRIVGEYLKPGESLMFCLDMFPRINKDELFQLLIERNNLRPEKPLHISFIGLINKRLINALLKEGEINDVNMPCRNVTTEQLDRLAGILKKWSFNITGSKSWSEAQVTAGGISVLDINPRTMESKLVPGLYFAGEVMDIDGDCGGYNLHWAWSTGRIAGTSAAMSDR